MCLGGGIGLEIPDACVPDGILVQLWHGAQHMHTCAARPGRLMAPRPVKAELKALLKTGPEAELAALKKRLQAYPVKRQQQGREEWRRALEQLGHLRKNWLSERRWRKRRDVPFACWEWPDTLRYQLLAQLERDKRHAPLRHRWRVVFLIPYTDTLLLFGRYTAHWRHPNYHGTNAAGKALRSFTGLWNQIEDCRVRDRFARKWVVVEVW